MFDFDFYVEKFVEYMMVCELAPTTIVGHRSRLNHFESFLRYRDVQDIREIDKEDIADYRMIRKNTINRFGHTDCWQVQNQHVTTLCKFFSLLQSSGYIVSNPMEGVKIIKKRRQHNGSILKHQEMLLLLDQPREHLMLEFRDKVMLELLYSAGIRRKGIHNLNDDDLYIEDNKMHVLEKGDNERMVPIGTKPARYLIKYLKEVRPKFKNADICKAAFMSKKGNRLSLNAIGDIVPKYAKRAKINRKKITAHTMRRSCATGLIRNEAPAAYVKDLLGHDSIDSLEPYYKLDISDLKRAHSKYHPFEVGE